MERELTKESGPVPFETLANDLRFEAYVFYNFWTEDEEINDQIEQGNQKIDELPRFVKLAWNRAPDVLDVREQQTRSQMLRDGSFPAFGAYKPVGTMLEGINFTPSHLQPLNFNQVALSLANGHIAAGVVEAVVDLNEDTVSPPEVISAPGVSEDEYLGRTDMWGIPYSEFMSAWWNKKSSIYGLRRHYGRKMSAGGTAAGANYFDGQYGVSSADGSMDITAATSASPAISLSSRTASSTRTYGKGKFSELLSSVAVKRERKDPWQRIKAKFIHTNLGGLVRDRRVQSLSSLEHAETVIALGPHLDNLAVYAESGMVDKPRDITIPSFPAPVGLKTIEYVGYVIEKFALDDGAFKLKDTIYIPGREFTEYYDTKIKYGTVYRYRIRSIARWTREQGIGVYGSDSTTSGRNFNIGAFSPNLASFFGTEWSRNWAYANIIDQIPPNPPDELTVRVSSREKRVYVSMKLPHNPQLDINRMTILRRLQDVSGRNVSEWETVKEISAEVRQGTRVTYGEANGEIISKEDFVEFAPINSLFIDENVEYFQHSNVRYVYTAMCHTLHGETSVLADQLSATLNEEWARTGEFPIEFVSCAGVDLDMATGVFAVIPERRFRSEIIFSGKAKLEGQPRVGEKLLNDSQYVMRVESLDTGQLMDIPVSVTFTNLPAVDVLDEKGVLIPSTMQ
jgi:hypothetical protein